MITEEAENRARLRLWNPCICEIVSQRLESDSGTLVSRSKPVVPTIVSRHWRTWYRLLRRLEDQAGRDSTDHDPTLKGMLRYFLVPLMAKTTEISFDAYWFVIGW